VQGWLERAGLRTATLVQQGRYEERSSIWSEVKDVFMRLQHYKCIFCERKLETRKFGRIEFDLEHFRPKSSVAVWPDGARSVSVYDYSTGSASPDGYYWLAYEIDNYAAACKACNTNLKLNFFPIASERGGPTSAVADLAAERPFLCYPLCGLDEDPSDLITFTATTAIPAQPDGHGRRRGELMIDFFDLNRRDGLHEERARMIAIFGPALRATSAGGGTLGERTLAQNIDSPSQPHANCLRAFRRLWNSDRTAAEAVLDRCQVLAAEA
jgi:hypothetical protein